MTFITLVLSLCFARGSYIFRQIANAKSLRPIKCKISGETEKVKPFTKICQGNPYYGDVPVCLSLEPQDPDLKFPDPGSEIWIQVPGSGH